LCFYIPVKNLLITIHVANTIETTATKPKTRFLVKKLTSTDINPSAYRPNTKE